MVTSYALEEYHRAYRESRLADAAQARLRARLPKTRESGERTTAMLKLTLRYGRYALTSLASVAFGISTN